MVPPTPASGSAPVLILGAGVNGACVARELALNGVPVVIADRHDLGGGATAKSSRLIHGGLRYLEYGEFALVRESLDERRRLLELAPHLVTPLRLHIPVRRRRGGLLHGAVRFVGWGRSRFVNAMLSALRVPSERGLWAARLGLWLYDRIAGRSPLPAHTVTRLPAAGLPPFDHRQYRWVCSYWDAQMAAPERFVVALLRDAEAAARDTGAMFELLTYAQARLEGTDVWIAASDAASTVDVPQRCFRPAMIVNATGAWGDATLAGLPLTAPRLFGGTRGSHIITRHAGLRTAIGDDAIYAEAPDGRLVFILPWLDAVLVGTTDERFEGDPAEAVATQEEIAYLVDMVRLVLPESGLTAADVESHYSGVRPLPYVPEGKTGAITRDHAIDSRTTPDGIPIDTLIGGKLTTCRAFGELAADRVLQRLGRQRVADTRSRPVPGGADYPTNSAELQSRISGLAGQHQLPVECVATAWRLFGTTTPQVLVEALAGNPGSIAASPDPRGLLPGTAHLAGVVDWIIRHEWVQTVADLVERRLLLAFEPGLRMSNLRALESRIQHVRGTCPQGAEAAAARLRQHYGIEVYRDEPGP